MKILKRILIVLAVFAVVILVAALFMKKDYAVVREIAINKPKHEVFDYVRNIKNQNFYSVWNMKDPNAKMSYKGTEGTVGFTSSWESDVRGVGTGEQEIKKIVEGDSIDMELRFKKPMEMTDYAYMATEAIDSTQTKVKWGFYGKMKYPMNVMLPFMNMDKMLGGDLETGLGNLKAILEKK
jgi:hypothetical protein